MQSTIKKSAKHLAVLKLFTIFAVVSDKSEGRNDCRWTYCKRVDGLVLAENLVNFNRGKKPQKSKHALHPLGRRLLFTLSVFSGLPEP